MNVFQPASRRRGGRAARQAERSTAPTMAPVRPGQEGGWYKPLNEADVGRIHAAALDLLAEVGLAGAIQSCVELVTTAGGQLTPEGRLLFPRALVEDRIALAGRHFVLPGSDPRHDLEPWGTKVHFGSAGAAVHMVDGESGEFRPSTLMDLYDIARLIDALEHIHFCQRSVIACDIDDPVALDVNTAYASSRAPPSTSARLSARPKARAAPWTCCTPWPAARRPGGPGPSYRSTAASWCRRCASPKRPASAWK